MNYVGLFEGISGFGLAFKRAGATIKAVCEIDKTCQAVLRRHHPEAEIFSDVKTINKNTFPSGAIDILAGGFPCQDLSVAGLRKGLAGERSGLFWEMLRVIKDHLPRIVVIENVPGLLSSNGGKDIQIVIDSLTQIGYTVDVDIKDAQEFGVAQRRRRVFLVCVRLDDLLQKKTNLSKQISTDLLAQTLLKLWVAIQPASFQEQPLLDSERQIERSVSSLQRTMSLLRLTQERLAFKKFQNVFDVLLDQYGEEGKNSASGLTRKSETPKGANCSRLDTLASESKVANGGTNISLWLSKLLEGVCEQGKAYTTSTFRKQITDQTIYTFAKTVLHIAERMLRSIDWLPSYWSAASSLSTLLQENISFARQASNELFIEPGLRDGWWDYLSTASHIQTDLEQRTRDIRAAEILFERESGGWDSPPRREAGEKVAGNAIPSSSDSSQSGWPAKIVGCLDTQFGRKCGQENQHINQGAPMFVPTLRSNGDAHSGFTTGDGSVVESQAVAYNLTFCDANGRRADRPNGGLYVNETEQANTLTNAGQSGTVIAFAQNTRDEVRQINGDGQIVGALAAQAGMKQQSYLAGQFGVRRLTPTECERLQGLPDGHTAWGVEATPPTGAMSLQEWMDWAKANARPISDSARYRMLGNAVCVPTAEWIARRIIQVAAV